MAKGLVGRDTVGAGGNSKAGGEAPIWICGGADVASTLMGAGLVDTVVVKLNPVLFGSGIPLVHDAVEQTALELTRTKVYSCGVVLLRYEVK